MPEHWNKIRNPSWFERHLNWSLVILCLPGTLSMRAASEYMILWFFGLILWLPVVFWVLREKGRSLWWLLVLLIPVIPLFIILCLENKREAKLL